MKNISKEQPKVTCKPIVTCYLACLILFWARGHFSMPNEVWSSSGAHNPNLSNGRTFCKPQYNVIVTAVARPQEMQLTPNAVCNDLSC